MRAAGGSEELVSQRWGLVPHWSGEPSGGFINARAETAADRMSVLLRADHYAAWLDPTLQDPEALRELLRPYPAARMAAYPVSRWMNDPRHEGPRCVQGRPRQALFL